MKNKREQLFGIPPNKRTIMTKVVDFLVRNAYKIIFTLIFALFMFIFVLCIYNIQSSLKYLTLSITDDIQLITENQQYIMNQNRERNDEPLQGVSSSLKPLYSELLSHEVWIEGCSGGKNHDNKMDFKLDADGECWGGTGVIIKITDTETYILTNNHVSGKEGGVVADKVVLYVKNDATGKLVKAEIVAQDDVVDEAVIKINTVLPKKVAITKIVSAKIQENVYVVGNPLGVRDIYAEGVVAGYEGQDLLIQVPCIYGNSGSGVFNSNGELVGIVYALEQYPGFAGIPEARITHSLVVDSVSIKTFLKGLGLYEK